MARAQFLTKADRAFQEKLKCNLGRVPYIHVLGHGDMEAFPEDLQEELTDEEVLIRHASLEHFDFVHIEHLFMCYGYYLELIDPEIDMTTAEVAERIKL